MASLIRAAIVAAAADCVLAAESVEIAHLAVPFNLKSLLSLVGIVLIYGGVWYVDRTWDERGSAAYWRVAGARHAGQAVGMSKFACAPATGGVETELCADVVIPAAELDAAFPFPVVFLLGWATLAASFLLNQEGVLAPNYLAMVACAALSVIASIPMGFAVRNRKATLKRILGLCFLLTWMVLAVSAALDANWKLRGNGVHLCLCLPGAVMIIMSMKLLWKHRKMGDSWEQTGAPNPDPKVYSPGAALFVVGWFFFFLGSCSQDVGYQPCQWESIGHCGVPIYMNVRTLLAFFGGCGMVPVVAMLDWAHDEGAEFTGFGTDGRFFGRFFESPAPFILMWTLFGLSSFFSLDGTFVNSAKSWIVCVNCILQAVVAGVLIQTSLYKGDMQGKNRWSVVFLLLWVCLFADSGFTPDFAGNTAHGLVRVFVGLGIPCIVAGQMNVFKDRKRGDYWMQHQEPNPNPIVYSVGEPLFMLGWILLSIGFSLVDPAAAAMTPASFAQKPAISLATGAFLK